MLIVDSARYHRNGSFGADYHAILFRHHDGKAWVRLGAIVFDAPEHVAILDDTGASWRCEDFEPELRRFIASPCGQQMVWGALAPSAVANEA